jgi:hypothetical protein
VKAHEVYNHKRQIYLILELCDGGDLYARLPVRYPIVANTISSQRFFLTFFCVVYGKERGTDCRKADVRVEIHGE